MSPPARAVALVGMRGSGKTTLARALAAQLGWDAVDCDQELAGEVGEPAGVHLRNAGEPAFRAVEERVTLRVLAGTERQVVALGGGAVPSTAVRDALADPRLFVVLLDVPLAELTARLVRGGIERPPLTDLSLEEEVRALWDARRALYENVSDFQLRTTGTNVDACCRRIIAKMS